MGLLIGWGWGGGCWGGTTSAVRTVDSVESTWHGLWQHQVVLDLMPSPGVNKGWGWGVGYLLEGVWGVEGLSES